MAPTKKARHDVSVLEEAVEAVRLKRMSLRKAAKYYGIAASTLGDKVTGKTPIKYVPHSLLTAHEEDRLAKWLLDMSELGFRQTTNDIRVKAKSIIKLRDARSKSKSKKDQNGETKNNMPSTAWVYRFFQRHPELTLVSPSNVRQLFEGFNPKQKKVIASKDAKTAHNETSNISPTSACIRLETPAPTTSHYNAKQLAAMENFALFVTDDLGRNGFLRCFQAISRDDTDSHEGFPKFQSLAADLKSAFQKEQATTPQSRVPRTLDDTPSIPSFSGKENQKKRKRTHKPTMKFFLSGAERT